MRRDDRQRAAILPSVGAPGEGEAAAVLPRVGLPGAGLAIARPRLELYSPLFAVVAFGLMFAGCTLVVLFASATPTWLVPTSQYGFPAWLAGPLHGITVDVVAGGLGESGHAWHAIANGFSVVMIVMTGAYVVAVAAARTVSMRVIAVVVTALYLLMLLCPPLQLNDVFNYIGYARLGALHGLNPYTHMLIAEQHDPVYGWVSWHHYLSPYGELFTLVTYPLGWLPLAVACWVLKLVTVGLALGFVALVYRCARQLGRDPRVAVVFVALNPIVLIYELGGFHNDPFMLVPAMGAISLLLARRYRWAGAVLMLAVAVKFTLVLLLPFVVLAAPSRRHRLEVLLGAALATIPIAALSVATFGATLPNLSGQSRIVTPYSILNLLGLASGVGGAAPLLIKLATVALALVTVVAAVQVARRRCDWLTAAGWTTVALLASIAWLMPWYVIWVLPLAALATSARLRRVTLGMTLFLVLTFAPLVGTVLFDLGSHPMWTPVGRASFALDQRFER
jgi:hypothetical protein